MINRRQFLTGVAFGLAGLSSPRSWASFRTDLPLAFSTLGTPEWEWLRILDAAKAHGYRAIELRTIQGTEDLPNRPEFGPERIEETRAELAARGLSVICMGSGARMHDRNPIRRGAHRDQVRRFIDLAVRIEAPYVRVFGDQLPEGDDAEAVLGRVAGGLREAGQYAAERGVLVLLETHGDFTRSEVLLEILERTGSEHVALLWDAHHTYVSGGEEPEETVRMLGPYIRHVHLKDSVPTDDGRRYVLTGEGDVPVERQVRALLDMGYTGFYSFEWEKRWHPTIEDPEVALPHFARVMASYAEAGVSE